MAPLSFNKTYQSALQNNFGVGLALLAIINWQHTINQHTLGTDR